MKLRVSRPQAGNLPHTSCLSVVGQIDNLRPIVYRPRTGPWKLLRRRSEAGSDRIHLDVERDAVKLGYIATSRS
jgi:hypothetical protein